MRHSRVCALCKVQFRLTPSVSHRATSSSRLMSHDAIAATVGNQFTIPIKLLFLLSAYLKLKKKCSRLSAVFREKVPEKID